MLATVISCLPVILHPLLKLPWRTVQPHRYFPRNGRWGLSDSRSSPSSKGLLALSLISPYLFTAFSQHQGLKLPFDGYFPPFDIGAKMFGTSLSFFLCQALTCRSLANIEDSGNTIENRCLHDIKVIPHHINNSCRVPFCFAKSTASSPGGLMNCNQQAISSPRIHSIMILEQVPYHLIYLILLEIKVPLVLDSSIRCCLQAIL